MKNRNETRRTEDRVNTHDTKPGAAHRIPRGASQSLGGPAGAVDHAAHPVGLGPAEVPCAAAPLLNGLVGESEEHPTAARPASHHLTATSKFMSLVLRHEPGKIGLSLDAAGWVPVAELVAKANAAGRRLTEPLVREVVRACAKQRFSFSEDGHRIRANQGHSIAVALGLPAQAPPAVLFHGTARRFLASILQSGLDKRKRHHVHLTTDAQTAGAVARRYGELVMLRVDAARMHADGHVFHVSANGVWLTDTVPAAYLAVMTGTPRDE